MIKLCAIIVTRVEVDKEIIHDLITQLNQLVLFILIEVEELQKEQPDSVFKEDAGRGYRKSSCVTTTSNLKYHTMS